MKIGTRLLLVVAMCWMMGSMEAQTKMEAENAQRSNCSVINGSMYSGGKAVSMTEGNSRLTFSFNMGNGGKYIVFVAGDGIGGEKLVNCKVNETSTAFRLNSYSEVEVGLFFMKQGNNTLTITPNWTWYNIDYVRFQSADGSFVFDLSATPVDTEATDAARLMYRFLHENFGVKSISGIMTGDMSTANGNVTSHADVRAVYQMSGKYPALIGFDFMNATGKSAGDTWMKDYTRSSIELAKDTYRRGGFPAFTWHWRDPSRSTNEFYTDQTNMRITNAMKSDGSWNTSSALYKNIIADIDAVADFFLELQEAGMACIFRPLHEASGGWFWWGREGAGPFKKLYKLVYEEMVMVKGVHNVIWVWNADPSDSEWNPGDEYFDVVSADIYNPDFDYSSNSPTFYNLQKLTQGKKIIALSENGPIPDIQKEVDEEAVWSWWMPWYQTWNGGFVNKTSPEEWRKCMNDPRVVTLDDLSGGWEAYAADRISTVSIAAGGEQSIYDLQGRALNRPPVRGIFIRNGKKVIPSAIP